MNLLVVAILWLMLWGGYTTTCFPNNYKSFNKWRSLLPILAGAFSLGLLFLNLPSFLSPLGLIMGYTLIGMVSAFYSPRDTFPSLWWAGMFCSPILVLLATHNPALVMNINWVVASLLSLGLMAFFLTRPGVLKGISFRSLFALRVRPFEGWLGVRHETNIFGIVGTRPTGLGRYAAIAALPMLCLFVTYHNWYWLLAFIVLTLIVLFSKGKMEMAAFIIAMGFILFASHNLLSPLMLVYAVIVAIACTIVFGNISHETIGVIQSSEPERVEYDSGDDSGESSRIAALKTLKLTEAERDILIKKKEARTRILTFSGRINGVWGQAMILIKKRLWFGYGFGIERYLLRDENGKPGSVDGVIFNTLLQSGIVGITLFIVSLAWTIFMAYQLFTSGNQSPMFLEALSVGIFLLLRGITQSFSSYGADWLFLVPIIAYISTRSVF